MRISTTMIMNSYADNLNSKYEDINKYSNQISTTMAYQRASENPVAAMQTIRSCTEYAINQQNQSNVGEASSWMATTESTLKSVNSIVTSAYEKAEEAANGTNSSSDFANYAVAFKSYSDEIVSTLNTSYDGQYIFGESTDGKPPFRIGTTKDDGAQNNGKLMFCNYNAKDASGKVVPTYVAVSSLTKQPSTIITSVNGVTTTSTGYTNVADALKLSTPISVGTDNDFDISTPGLDVIIQDFTGNFNSTTTSGVTTTGITISNTATDIVDQLNSVVAQLTKNPPDISGLSNLVTTASNAQNAILKVTVAVGEKSNMLTQISGRLTDNETNLTSALANSMEVDSTQAVMKYNMAETVYKESMSIASTVLQTSLFDFIK